MFFSRVFQEAGVKLGDLLVSVDSIVADTPKQLAQGLRETGVSQSGKLVVMKVQQQRNIGKRLLYCFTIVL